MPGCRTRAAAAALLLLLGPAGALAFRGMQPGAPLRDREMHTLDGGQTPLLGKARVSVVVFFRTGQDHSLQVLRQMAQLEQELAKDPVRFVAVVSDGDDRAEVRGLLAETGLRMPVLIDRGDELYGEWSVALHPVVGIAGANHRLASYQHFLKINMLDAVRARIQHALGTIGDKQLEAALHPPRPPPRPPSVARHHVALGQALLKRGRVELALGSAQKAVAADPGSAEAHGFLADALAAAGRCPEALAARATARALAPSLPAAPLPGCPGSTPAR